MDRNFLSFRRAESFERPVFAQGDDFLGDLRRKSLAPPALVDQQVAQVVMNFRLIPDLVHLPQDMVVMLLQMDWVVELQAFKKRVLHGSATD